MTAAERKRARHRAFLARLRVEETSGVSDSTKRKRRSRERRERAGSR